MGHRLSTPSVGFREMKSEFNLIEIFMLKLVANWRLNQVVKRDGPTIIDFHALPCLGAAKKFRQNILIQSDDSLRVQKKAERDRISFEDAQKIEERKEKIGLINYAELNYDLVIFNDYK